MPRTENGSEIAICRACRSALSDAWDSSPDRVLLHQSFYDPDRVDERCPICDGIWAMSATASIHGLQDGESAGTRGFSSTVRIEFVTEKTKALTFIASERGGETWEAKCEYQTCLVEELGPSQFAYWLVYIRRNGDRIQDATLQYIDEQEGRNGTS